MDVGTRIFEIIYVACIIFLLDNVVLYASQKDYCVSMLHTYFVHPSHIISRFVPTDPTGQQPGSTAISRTRRPARRATIRPLSPPLGPESAHPFILSLSSPNYLLFQEILETSILERAGKKRDGLFLIIFQIKPHKLVNEPMAETRGKKTSCQAKSKATLIDSILSEGKHPGRC